MYQLKEYKKAAHCFYKAMCADLNFTDTYKYYSLLKIWQGEYEAALKIIKSGMKVRGMDQSMLLTHISIIHEWKGEFKEAKVVLKKAKLFCIDHYRIRQIDNDLSRIKRKMKSLKVQNKKAGNRLVVI